jgi:hypothetical protein
MFKAALMSLVTAQHCRGETPAMMQRLHRPYQLKGGGLQATPLQLCHTDFLD